MTFSEFIASIYGQILVQLIGFFAMALGILSFQRKKRSAIIGFQMSASVLWTTQFIFLGGYTGAMQNFIAIIRGAVLTQKGKYRWVSSYVTLGCIMLAFIASGFITFRMEGARTLIPIAANLFQTVALYSDKEKTIRLLSLFVCPLWLIYDILTGSIAGIFCECFGIASIVIALWRFRGASKKSADDDVIKDQ